MSISVQRDHIADVRRRRSGVYQMSAIFSIEKTIELLELSSLSLPSDPPALGFAPRAGSGKKGEETIAVTGVELFDTFYCESQQVIIFRHFTFFCVGEVRQQRKRKVRHGIR